MPIDRPNAQEQLARDFTVRPTGSNELDYLELARRRPLDGGIVASGSTYSADGAAELVQLASRFVPVAPMKTRTPTLRPAQLDSKPPSESYTPRYPGVSAGIYPSDDRSSLSPIAAVLPASGAQFG